MRETDSRDRYQRKLSRMRSKYQRRIWIVFIMALVLGFLLGWIVCGWMIDDRKGGANGTPLLIETPAPTEIPARNEEPVPTWDDATEEPTGEPTEEPTGEPTSDAGLSSFLSEATETPAATEAAAVETATATTELTDEPTAEATVEATIEATAVPTDAPLGSKENPVKIGESFSFTAQVNADGTKRIAATEEAAFDLPVTITLSSHLLPEYYAQTYSTQFQIRGDEAGAQLDVELGAVEGLASVSMQDAVLVVFEDAAGEVVQGYKFTNAEIGGKTESTVKTGAQGTIYKRYKFDPSVELAYLTVTYYVDAQPTTVYFSLTESILPEETPAPEATAQPTDDAQATSAGESYTVGSSGESVKKLQQKLIDLGYLYGKPDGKFGNYTAEAIKVAQKDMGLAQTGIADAEFLDALYKR